MTTYEIKQKTFLNWFFNTCDDQWQHQERVKIGYNAAETLVSGETFTLTPEEVFDTCEHTVIPAELIEGFSDSDLGEELGDILNGGEWELKMID